MTLRRAAGGILGEVLGLVLPLECAGCGRWDERLCEPCRDRFGRLRRVEHGVPRLDQVGPGGPREPLPVWAAADYAGPVRTAVGRWKDGGRSDVTPLLHDVVRDGARRIAPLLAAAAGDGVAVVPVPSSPGSRRRRGADLTRDLARAVACGLAAGGVDARVTALIARRTGRDQVGLGARARGRNTDGAWRLRTQVETGSSHLLVDDVVTTGSTLAGCEHVLSGSGGLVLGAVVLAATPPPTGAADRLPRTADEG